MTRSALRNLRAHREFAAAVMGLTGLVIGAGFVGSAPAEPVAGRGPHAQVAQAQDRCAGGTEVSAFVCRNTWLAYVQR
jgi:hypothetical protein